MAYNYTLYALPLPGLTDITQTAGEVELKLNSTRQYIAGILQCPAGLSQTLRQAINNIDFQANAGLGFIDAFKATGHNLAAPMMDVEGLQNALDLQIAEITKTKPIWDAWHKDSVAQGIAATQLPPPPPNIVGGAVPTAPATPSGGGIQSALSSQMELRDYVAVGIVAGVGLLLWKMLK